MRYVLFSSIFAVLLVATPPLFAQNFQAQYLYDANGNRISAMIIYLDRGSDDEAPLAVSFDDWPEVSLRVYPNPTSEMLRIDILCDDPTLLSEYGSLSLYDIQGKKLLDIYALGEENSIDFTAYPSGIYLIRLRMHQTSKIFKVIKQ